MDTSYKRGYKAAFLVLINSVVNLLVFMVNKCKKKLY